MAYKLTNEEFLKATNLFRSKEVRSLKEQPARVLTVFNTLFPNSLVTTKITYKNVGGRMEAFKEELFPTAETLAKWDALVELEADVAKRQKIESQKIRAWGKIVVAGAAIAAVGVGSYLAYEVTTR